MFEFSHSHSSSHSFSAFFASWGSFSDFSIHDVELPGQLGSLFIEAKTSLLVCNLSNDLEYYSDSTTVVSELDALGDELLLDDDTSYLDEASAAPSIPEGIPSDSKTNKVTVYRAQFS